LDKGKRKADKFEIKKEERGKTLGRWEVKKIK
jgi:hypothetical protein